MKSIPLNPPELGLFALVSDEDYERVKDVNWQAFRSSRTYYVFGHVPEVGTILLHRFLLDAPAGVVVDHRDRNGLNCQRDNLRLATHSQNMANRAGGRMSASGYRGVFPSGNKWFARIGINGKQEHLGWFTNKLEAAAAYDVRAVELFGEFAMTNEQLSNLGICNIPPTELQISDGSKVLLDYVDYRRAMKLSWARHWTWVNGERVRRVYTLRANNHRWYLEHFVLGKPRGLLLVHQNGDRLDFRRANLAVGGLRLASQKHAASAKSGFKGVYPRASRWKALISDGQGGRKYLGSFPLPEQAALAYDRAARELYGPTAVLNFPAAAAAAPGQLRLTQRVGPSGFFGVSKRGGKWKALLTVGINTRKYLGLWATAEDAARAYDRAAVAHYGKLIKLNFPEEWQPAWYYEI